MAEDRFARAKFDYEARSSEELAFKTGDTIKLISFNKCTVSLHSNVEKGVLDLFRSISFCLLGWAGLGCAARVWRRFAWAFDFLRELLPN